MKKNLIASIIVSLAMTGIFGGVSFAADKAADTKPAVTTEAKADAPAPKAKAKKKKATKKKDALNELTSILTSILKEDDKLIKTKSKKIGLLGKK